MTFMYVKIVVNSELLLLTMKIRIIKVNESIFSYEKCSFVVGKNQIIAYFDWIIIVQTVI